MSTAVMPMTTSIYLVLKNPCGACFTMSDWAATDDVNDTAAPAAGAAATDTLSQ